jgi:transposase
LVNNAQSFSPFPGRASQDLCIATYRYQLSKIAQQLKRSPGCINLYVKNPKKYGRKHPGGRPRKLSKRDECLLTRIVSNSTLSARPAAGSAGLNVSKWTVLRAIHRKDTLAYSQPKNTPKLTPKHKQYRLDFARHHMATNWNQVNVNVKNYERLAFFIFAIQALQLNHFLFR